MTTFIDTNVLIDLLDDNSANYGGCLEKMEEARALGRVFISDVVYSEASMGMASKEAIDEVVHVLGLRVRPIIMLYDIIVLRCV